MIATARRIDDVYLEIRQTLDSSEDDKIKAADVLQYAKENPTSATYKWMEARGAFDPERAMEKYGLALARRLIVKVRITVMDKENVPMQVRAYQSLHTDRMQGGGYRSTQTVLGEEAMRKEALGTMLKEARALQQKYSMFSEAREVLTQAVAALEKIAS